MMKNLENLYSWNFLWARVNHGKIPFYSLAAVISSISAPTDGVRVNMFSFIYGAVTVPYFQLSGCNFQFADTMLSPGRPRPHVIDQVPRRPDSGNHGTNYPMRSKCCTSTHSNDFVEKALWRHIYRSTTGPPPTGPFTNPLRLFIGTHIGSGRWRVRSGTLAGNTAGLFLYDRYAEQYSISRHTDSQICCIDERTEVYQCHTARWQDVWPYSSRVVRLWETMPENDWLHATCPTLGVPQELSCYFWTKLWLFVTPL